MTEIITSENVRTQGLYPGAIVMILRTVGPQPPSRENLRRVVAVDGINAKVRVLHLHEWWIYKGIRWIKKQIHRKFPEYEPGSAFWFFVLPYDLGWWCIAWLWTQVWYPTCRLHWWIRNNHWTLFKITRHFLPLGGGRREDVDAIYCEKCLWAGPVRWLTHGYEDDGSGEDVSPCDYCPRCQSEI